MGYTQAFGTTARLAVGDGAGTDEKFSREGICLMVVRRWWSLTVNDPPPHASLASRRRSVRRPPSVAYCPAIFPREFFAFYEAESGCLADENRRGTGEPQKKKRKGQGAEWEEKPRVASDTGPVQHAVLRPGNFYCVIRLSHRNLDSKRRG
jgi:hypothetical protein